MAAVSEQTRVNFNPEWMGSTYSAPARFSQGGGPGGFGNSFGGPSGGGGNPNSGYCGGSAANNAEGSLLAPPKLAKNRYSREDLLALFIGNATVAPPELKTRFPEFFVEHHQDAICVMPLTDVEERLLLQGGINSSKAINVVNHAERHLRWNQQGPVRPFGRGMPPNADQPPDAIAPGSQSPNAPPFVGPRASGFIGVGRGMGRGFPPGIGGIDPMIRPGGRFGIPKGRGDGGRGRGFDRYPGGFGGPGAYAQGGGRFSSEGVGGQPQNEEEWAAPTPQNTRAQGLYDPNDPRDRPRQRLKSRNEDDDPNGASYGQPGQIRTGQQRRSFTAPIGQSVPEWAMDDDDMLDDQAVGSFDASGQFQEASEFTSGKDADDTVAMTKMKPDQDEKSTSKLTAEPPVAASSPMKTAPDKSPVKQKPAEDKPSDKQSSKLMGRSIPVESLFGNQQQSEKPETPPVQIAPGASPQPNQNRRVPKAFSNLDQQANVENKTAAQASDANLDMPKAKGGQQQKQAQYGVPPFRMDSGQHQPQQQRKENVQQPKFVVPKTISSSSDDFTQLHEDVESLVNSFSADDMPANTRSKDTGNIMDTVAAKQLQQMYQMGAIGTTANAPHQTVTPMRNVNAILPQTMDRVEPVNIQRGLERWYYKDPQGGFRGPFDSTQMSAWFAAGYFTMQLLVRREEDPDFVPLGEMIKQCGRIPFISSSSSSTAETPSPNPLLTATTMSSDVVQPAAKYGVAAAAATLGSAHNVPTNILGALTNNTGGGAFQKTGGIKQPMAAAPGTTVGASGGLWDMEFASSNENAEEMQARLITLQKMLQVEREGEMKRRAQEEERRKMAEREAARRKEDEQRQLQLLKEKEEELRRLQEMKAEAERRRKEAEEEEARRRDEARRLEEKRILEEQQRRLEELAKKEEEEKRKRAAEEERLRKERDAKEAAERKRREEEERRAAAERKKREEEERKAALLRQLEQQRQEEERRKQQMKKSPVAPWSAQPAPPQAKNGPNNLMEIQKEEERQIQAEKRQEAQLGTQKRQNAAPTNVPFGSAWGSGVAASKLTWENQAAAKQQKTSGPAWGGKGEVQNIGDCGLWEDDESPPATPQKTAKNSKPSQPAKTGTTKNTVPPAPASSKKEQNVKRIFQTQQSPSDEFTSWCVKQVAALNSDIDALTFVTFLKEVDAPAEVEDYIIGYFGDCRSAREFTKAFLEKRNGLRKSASKTQADDLSTPAPALNPMKNAGENTVPASEKGNVAQAGGGNKKKKSGKSAGRFVVDGSILGFKATADPNRLNAGEIDSPM